MAAVLPAMNPERDANGRLDQRHGDGRLAWPAAPATRRPAGTVTPRRVSRWRNRSRPGQPAPDRDLREPELMRRRGIGQPLQVAEHDGCAKPLGQAVDLLVEDLPIGVVLRREIAFGGPLRDALVERCRRERAPLTAIRHAVRDPEQPARDRSAPADGPGPVGQNEEDGLKRILRIVRVVKNAPADPKHHRAVADHQLFEGRLRGLIAPRDDSVQELRDRTSSRPLRQLNSRCTCRCTRSDGLPAILSDLLGC